MSKSKNKVVYIVNTLLLHIVVFFVFFDSIRSNVIGGNYLTLVREAASVYLIGYTFLVCNPRKNDIITIPLALFIVYHVFISLTSIIISEGLITWAFIIKPLELIGMIFVFDNYCELTNGKYRDLVRMIVLTAVAFGIVNVLLYFIPLPIWNRTNFWWGRISCGYPTMDVISLCYALVLLIYYKDLRWKNIYKILLSALLSLFIILNFSGTGTVLLMFIMIFSLFINYSRQIIGSVSLICIFLITLGTASVKEFFPTEYSNGIYLLETKYKNIMNDKSADSNTLDIRKKQFEKVKRRIDNIVVDVLGIGLNYATNDSKVLKDNKDAYMIENEYNLIRICYGYLGLTLFLILILHLFISSTATMNYIGMLGVGIFAVNNYILISLVLFPNYVLLAVFYVFTYRQKQIERQFYNNHIKRIRRLLFLRLNPLKKVG